MCRGPIVLGKKKREWAPRWLLFCIFGNHNHKPSAQIPLTAISIYPPTDFVGLDRGISHVRLRLRMCVLCCGGERICVYKSWRHMCLCPLSGFFYKMSGQFNASNFYLTGTIKCSVIEWHIVAVKRADVPICHPRFVSWKMDGWTAPLHTSKSFRTSGGTGQATYSRIWRQTCTATC